MTIGLPHDGAQWIALGLALAIAIAGKPLLCAGAARPRIFVAAAAALASALSIAYVAVYLRGGPRIVDATTYWLEARALAGGRLAWPAGEPEASAIGRFLVRGSSPGTIAAIFPPGYPAVLALGFLAGAPMMVGPVLAAFLVVLTWDLAQRVASEPSSAHAAEGAASLESIAPCAVVLSVTCAALRYHTADTMSHGLSAACFAGALAAALRIEPEPKAQVGRLGRIAPALVAGACVGWLAATRPASALAAACAVAFAAGRPLLKSPDRARLVAAFALGLVPGLALLAAHRLASTGDVLRSAQEAYYAVSDGPPGCFRYGFGEGVGCLGEHGDFVRSRLASGYGALAAAGTTLRRLKMHLLDVANFEPLALLVAYGAIVGARGPAFSRSTGVLAAAVVLQIAAYVPFYFDGNYPGGGARFFADVLPLEHVLVASALVRLAARGGSWSHAPAAALALSLAGFAFRAGFDHALLRDREGGRPMFEPARVAAAGVDRALVFVATDHGYSLGAGTFATGPVKVARQRGDALDWMAWDAAGRPLALSYRYDWTEPGAASVRLEPREMAAELPPVIEGESLWPPLATERAWSWPEHASGTCASAGRWLAVHGLGSVTVSLPTRWLAGRQLRLRVAGRQSEATVELQADGRPVKAEVVRAPGPDPTCFTTETWLIPASCKLATVRVERRGQAGGLVALDAVLIGPAVETR